MFSSHCHSFNKQSRKEYINRNWLEFYWSEHESYVSNSWFWVVRESFIFIWILINRADIVSCPFFPFSLSLFSHLVRMISRSPSFLLWSARNNTIECLFPIKLMQQHFWRLLNDENCTDPKIRYLCRHEQCLNSEVAKGPKNSFILRTSKRILITRQWTKRCLIFRILSKCN